MRLKDKIALVTGDQCFSCPWVDRDLHRNTGAETWYTSKVAPVAGGC